MIEWVNHASFVVHRGNTHLICDPWLEGTAFKDGWSLTAPTVFRYEDFGRITHIWLSHQHPDHFAPTNLKKIDPSVRRNLTVLYQETLDKLVVNWCKSAGFGRVVELPLNRWHRLNDDVSIQCGTVTHDSWLAVRAGDMTLLNVNDCVLKKDEVVEPIAELVSPVDVLFTQFSYAQWTGNPEESAQRRKDALEKYERIALQDRILQPKTIVPFASFVYFCHEENFFLNDGMNDVRDVAAFVETRLGKKAVVLYPGESWDPRESKDWRSSADRYADALRRALEAGPAYFRRSAQPRDVETAATAFLARLRRKNPHARRLLLSRTSVYLTDVERAYEFSIHGVKPLSIHPDEADIATSSENVLYAFRTPWGGNTLHVSGRFTSARHAHGQFFAFMRAVHHYNVTPLNAAWLLGLLRRGGRVVARRIGTLRRHADPMVT